MAHPLIKFKRLNQSAIIPSAAHSGDSGLDVRASIPEFPNYIAIRRGETVTIPTGIAAAIPHGYEIQVRPRSGMSKKGLMVHFGTVDQGYTGEIKITMSSISMECAVIEDGERIAQFVLAPVVSPVVEELDGDLPQTERGANGFGSTGLM